MFSTRLRLTFPMFLRLSFPNSNASKADDFDDLNLFLAPKDLCWSAPPPKPMEKRNNNSTYKPALRDNSDYIERDDYWKRKIRSMITMILVNSKIC
ncbi:unnamed protein product [Rhizophagus irregularis]|nr:unnamed protein product [Rhizophagus irregularis]CAB5391075.1 unnamed protein product [Rhizophagus irregularis]